MRFLITLTILTLTLTGCSIQSGEQQAKERISQFYAADQSVRPQGALNLQELLAFREFVSIPLFELLKDVSELQEDNAESSDTFAEPLIDGDPFSSNASGITNFSIMHCAVQDGDKELQICQVALTYQDTRTAQISWTDNVVLTKDARGWVIDNIMYGGNTPDLRNGNLHNLLLDILSSTEIPHELQDGS